MSKRLDKLDLRLGLVTRLFYENNVHEWRMWPNEHGDPIGQQVVVYAIRYCKDGTKITSNLYFDIDLPIRDVAARVYDAICDLDEMAKDSALELADAPWTNYYGKRISWGFLTSGPRVLIYSSKENGEQHEQR